MYGHTVPRCIFSTPQGSRARRGALGIFRIADVASSMAIASLSRQQKDCSSEFVETAF